MTLCNIITKASSAIPPRLAALGIAAVSAFSLAAALTAQFGFGLLPCTLCLYQRVPFSLNILLGLAGRFSKNAKVTTYSIALSGLSFLINSGIAFYHSGVERKWWAGLQGCSTPDMSGSIEEVMARIAATNVTRCDEIPWSLFGLSMANYNVMMCLGLAVLCGVYLIARRKAPSA